ncbi:hypothetical protein CCGE531_00610 [Rhizobium sp. CCGE531]|nr:hypothetical protein CCGE531_00610 [Rhizobium sp. CCGE531]AYG71142.1 hypothetical protein CCGE532_00610 [Rhizobium sp. CCGE532]
MTPARCISSTAPPHGAANRAIPGKVRSGFPSGIARKQTDGAVPRFREKLNLSRLLAHGRHRRISHRRHRAGAAMRPPPRDPVSRSARSARA